MQYLIYAVLIVLFFTEVFKAVAYLVSHFFGNPYVNSIVSIILYIVLSVQYISKVNSYVILFVSIPAIIDCMIDLKYARKYYDIKSTYIADKYFITKSIAAFFTFGAARAVWLLIVRPIKASKVKRYVRNTFKREKILLDLSYNSEDRYQQFVFSKYVDKCVEKGAIRYVICSKYPNLLKLRSNAYIDSEYAVTMKYLLIRFIRSREVIFFDDIVTDLYSENVIDDIKNKDPNLIRTFLAFEFYEFGLVNNLIFNGEISDEDPRITTAVYLTKDYFVKFRQIISDFMRSERIIAYKNIAGRLKNSGYINDISSRSNSIVNSLAIFVIDGLCYQGSILCNSGTVETYTEQSRKKNDTAPKKFLQKMGEIFTESGKQRKQQRADNNLLISMQSDSSVYIDIDYFEKCQKDFSDYMSLQGMLSVDTIIADLQNEKIIASDINVTNAELKFYVMFVLDSLAEQKILEKMNVNDNDVFDNCQYKHSRGKQMLSRALPEDFV